MLRAPLTKISDNRPRNHELSPWQRGLIERVTAVDATRAAHKSAGFLFGFSAPAEDSPHEIASFSPSFHLLNIRNSIIMIIMLDFTCEPDAHSFSDIYLTNQGALEIFAQFIDRLN